MTNDQLTDLVDKAVSSLGEHFETVQILVSWPNEEDTEGPHETASYEKGVGNFFARQGQIYEWLEIQKQYQRNHAIRKDQNRDS